MINENFTNNIKAQSLTSIVLSGIMLLVIGTITIMIGNTIYNQISSNIVMPTQNTSYVQPSSSFIIGLLPVILAATIILGIIVTIFSITNGSNNHEYHSSRPERQHVNPTTDYTSIITEKIIPKLSSSTTKHLPAIEMDNDEEYKTNKEKGFEFD